MAWTSPRTWSVGELVTASLLNTHLRDNLLYLKDNPVLDEQVRAAGTANLSALSGNQTTILTSSTVAIPAGVGAVYVEAWGHFVATNPVTGQHQNSTIAISEATAGVVAGVSWNAGGDGPFYFRSQDLAYGGTSRTFTLYGAASFIDLYVRTASTVGSTNYAYTFPVVMRVVRSY